MGWYATENIEEAVEEAKDFLLPFEWSTWWRMAVIVLFAGGFNTPNIPTGPLNSASGPDYGSTMEYTSSGIDSTLHSTGLGDAGIPVTGMATGLGHGNSALLAIVLLVIGFFLVFLYLNSVFQFIFYQSLLDREASIRENFSRHKGRGLRFFSFQSLYLLGIILMVILAFGGFFLNIGIGTAGLLTGLVGMLTLGILSFIVHDLVLLRMMESGEGLVKSFRDIWPQVREEWKQVAFYILLKSVLGIAIGLASMFVILPVALLVLIPFLALSFIGIYSNFVFLALAVILYLIIMLSVALAVSVPLKTFLYYYIILFYHDLTS